MKFIRDLLNRKSDTSSAPAPKQPAAAPADRETAAYDLGPEQDTAAVAEMPKRAALKIVDDASEAAPAAAEAPAPAVQPDPPAQEKSSEDILETVNAQVAEDPAPQPAAAPVNIWDIDGDDAPSAGAAPARRRRRRNQTRVLGYDDHAEEEVNPFEKAAKVAPTARAKFPVGWVLVTDGPGRGECFSLEAGMSQIGRADDQAIQLDFGDNSISRENHAAIVYDPDTYSFVLGHGGKRNIVRLNGNPVISNETITTGSEIKIGETTLRFVALCTEEFNWGAEEDGEEEHEDVAIA